MACTAMERPIEVHNDVEKESKWQRKMDRWRNNLLVRESGAGVGVEKAGVIQSTSGGCA